MEFEFTLKALRKERRLTQSELASMVGTTERVVGAWEREETAISLEDSVKVADVLDCTPNDLCGWTERGHAADMPPDEQELVDCYRSVDGERKDRLLKNARDAALVAKKDEPGALPLPQQQPA